MVPPEPRGQITGRLDNSNPEDIKNHNFKHYLMKIMETFKVEVKISLKEVKERQTKIERN